jgi:hypothetical protein
VLGLVEADLQAEKRKVALGGHRREDLIDVLADLAEGGRHVLELAAYGSFVVVEVGLDNLKAALRSPKAFAQLPML